MAHLLFTGTDKGGKIQVNDLLAIIGKPGEDISTLVKRRCRCACGSFLQPTAAPAAAPAKQETPSTANRQPSAQAAPALDLVIHAGSDPDAPA